MDDAKQQLIEQLKVAANILVTVSRDPSVDQLASCIGLTLLLNKQGKHAAAVFSGQVPSTLEFLQPEETIEKNTDSLRDFIIALDKSKADKLRYKVEDNVVRIFITPYKTSISQDDLEFSEGDFNVDVVIALGVRQQEDLDEAITAHGRILHDATVASINTTPDAGLGTINWNNPEASSLSELVVELAQSFEGDSLDQQIATALLTGIVSETERFSNDKTSSATMSASAALMAAGANQQLVASKLDGSTVLSLNQPAAGDGSPAEPEDAGTLRIDHIEEPGEAAEPSPSPDSTTEPPAASPDVAPGDLLSEEEVAALSKPEASSGVSPGSKLVTEPPTLGGRLTANSTEEALEPTSDPLSLPSAEAPQMLDHKPEMRIQSTSELAAAPEPTGSRLPMPKPTAAGPTAPAPELPDETLISSPGGGPSITSPFPISEPTPPASQAPASAPAATPGAAPSPAWLSPPSSLAPVPTPAPTPANNTPPAAATDGDRTLSELEQSLDSPHAAAENLDEARDEVTRALASTPADGTVADEPIQGLSAQPLGGPLHNDAAQSAPGQAGSPQTPDSNSPPPVPPPIPFQFGSPSPPPNPPA
jgi:hypothetical protein